MVVAAVPTFADVPAADWNSVMETTTAMAADGIAVMEATAAAVKATAATMASTASGICRDRQNHRATQHGSTCSEFRHEVQHGCRNSTHPDAYSITFVRQRLFFTSIQCFGWSGR